MSSGLVVKKSGIDEKYCGQRVWFNPMQLGFGAMTNWCGDAKTKKTARTKKESRSRSFNDGSDEDDEEEEMNEEQLVYKSAWIHHLTLSEDLMTEEEGNEIRPITGLEGVDWLADIGPIKIGASYVFSKVISVLEKAGFQRGVNVDAAPYDWRLPPSYLEERDGYFTATMRIIERMYALNEKTPVVVLGHSMGARIAHYLFNFALKHRGQEWLDKYVHTYMPVGGPHLGVPRSCLQAFTKIPYPLLKRVVSMNETQCMARSWGSAPLLITRTLPTDVAAVPNMICREEGCLQIGIKGSVGDCNTLLDNPASCMESLRVCINYGKERLKSRLSEPNDNDGTAYFTFSETFIFSTSPTLELLPTFELELREPSTFSYSAWKKEKDAKAVIKKMFDTDYHSRKLAYLSTSTDSEYRTIATTGQVTICTDTLLASEGYEIDIPVTFNAQTNTEQKAPSVEAIVHVQWKPPLKPDPDFNPPLASISTESSRFAPTFPIQSSDNPTFTYREICAHSALIEGMGDQFFKVCKEQYELDPIGPRTTSAEDAPPVKRVYAIYGINLPTPCGGLFCRIPAMVAKQGKIKPRFTFDKSATIDLAKAEDEYHRRVLHGYQIIDGEIFETKSTYQKDLETGCIKCCSGDGSVPYWSLQQPQAWKNSNCNVRITELEGAEHRDILGDKRFHNELVDYLRGKTTLEAFSSNAVK